MSIVRPFAPADLDSLYAISLATGDSGQDAAPLHTDGKLIGHIYSAPYGVLLPELAFVAEDDEGVGGYVVGTTDTSAFDRQLERDWWPALRQRYPDPSGTAPDTRTADEKRIFAIHHPAPTPDAVLEAFPAHMHMNLLTRLQGTGMGRRLFERWIEQARARGVRAVHVGVSPTNARGLGFWQAMGFRQIATPSGVWLGQAVD
ncbi:GNAT family N-acetyltransferase [uncultured Devosia sp.]|uniref:GNAT family N-acetyltransferase n=1 Tax=uncultured Devosia sp. TaxID=211434 RepID=UPI0035CAA137